MCRHLAYLGPPATLRSLIIDPPYGLYRQAWAPRRQRYGTVNADGFGVGWYAPGEEDPVRYRRAEPIWGDESFADVARVTRSGAVLAAVRCATSGTALGSASVAPFASGGWLFSHNGRIDGWRACGSWTNWRPTSGWRSTTVCSPPGPTLRELAGERQAPVADYRQAALRATSLPERRYLAVQAARLDEERGAG
jgi:predicted glutamine amidotransferase